jgi:hypothetical protein
MLNFKYMKKLIEKIKSIFSRKPLLVIPTVSGNTPHPEEILTPEQIDKALKWYDNHRNHVNSLVNGVSKFPPSLNEDKRDCRLWKPQHWNWFLGYYH